MSRIGKKPIELPKGVDFSVKDGQIVVKGPKGQLETPLHPSVTVDQKDATVEFTRVGNSKPARAAHGLMRALTANMVTGVSKGFERALEINGVGYRAEVKGKQLVMQLGFSHPINFDLPEGVSAKVAGTTITLSGIDKELVGKTAAKVRSFRPPEPYKGKGVKYVEEQIQRKVGKAGAG